MEEDIPLLTSGRYSGFPKYDVPNHEMKLGRRVHMRLTVAIFDNKNGHHCDSEFLGHRVVLIAKLEPGVTNLTVLDCVLGCDARGFVLVPDRATWVFPKGPTNYAGCFQLA